MRAPICIYSQKFVPDFKLHGGESPERELPLRLPRLVTFLRSLMILRNELPYVCLISFLLPVLLHAHC